jgi:hypothetical protein
VESARAERDPDGRQEVLFEVLLASPASTVRRWDGRGGGARMRASGK